jgi:hypothetical protein
MPKIEYTKFKNDYLITSFETEPSDTVCFSFKPECDAQLFLRGVRRNVVNGCAQAELKSLIDGEYTPVIVRDGGESGICQKLLCEAGTVFPLIRTEEALIDANRRITELYEKLKKTEKLISAIYRAEHPGTIF